MQESKPTRKKAALGASNADLFQVNVQTVRRGSAANLLSKTLQCLAQAWWWWWWNRKRRKSRRRREEEEEEEKRKKEKGKKKKLLIS